MTPVKKETLVLLAIIFVIGLGLRIGHVEFSSVVNPTKADAGEYLAAAVNLFENGVYSSDTENDPPIPDSFRSPGYPVFLVGVRALAGPDLFYDYLKRIQAILGALMIPLSFLLARRFLGVSFALIAAALTATSPHLITAPGYMLTETLFGFLLLAAVVLLYGGLAAGGRKRIISAGVCFGLATLTNETALVIAPTLMVAHLIWGKGESRLRVVILLLAAFAVLPVGWRIRNAVSVPPEGRKASQRALATIAHGTYPGFVHEDPRWKYYPYRDDPQYWDLVRSPADFRRIFFKRASERPWRYLSWYLLEKPYHLFGFSYLQGYSDIHLELTKKPIFTEVPASMIFYWLHRILHPVFVVLLAAALVMWLIRRKRSDLWETPGPLLAIFLLYVLIGIVFAPWPRYLIPLKPFLFAAALWPLHIGLAQTLARTLTSWRTRRPPSGP